MDMNTLYALTSVLPAMHQSSPTDSCLDLSIRTLTTAGVAKVAVYTAALSRPCKWSQLLGFYCAHPLLLDVMKERHAMTCHCSLQVTFCRDQKFL